MKTILSRLKTLIRNNMVAGGSLSYVKHVEIIHPDIFLTTVSVASLPAILFVPDRGPEEWTASQQKQALNTVFAYLIISYHQRESSIMGDSTRPIGHGKGILDFAQDFNDLVRGHQLSANGSAAYLARPIDIIDLDFIREDLNENVNLLVAQYTLLAVREFLQTSLPGDI